MYLQITTRCNMRCDHCCFSCEPGKGEDMSRKTFLAALDCLDDYAAIGGGEPTVHPDFERILLEVVATVDEPLVITNGKNKKRALMLAKLANKKAISAQLSQDEYHEEIDPEVVSAFEALGNSQWGQPVGIRNTTDTQEPSATGRALETYYEGEDYEDIVESAKFCMCEDHIIRPNGDIVQCGCDGSPVIGNVFDGWTSLEDEYGNVRTCYKKAVKKELQPA